MTAPWVQTASGAAFDLLDPRAESVRFAFDVAPALARIPRFNGHVPSGPYSVAQHCVIGADMVVRETGNVRAAAHFLLHDAHEAYVGDIARPVAAAIAVSAARSASSLVPIGSVVDGIATLKARIDVVIHEAARLPAITPEEQAIVSEMDERMLETERRLLLPTCERRWSASTKPLKLPGGLKPWPWPVAAERWLEALSKFCPNSSF
jgi:hypothetical protein